MMRRNRIVSGLVLALVMTAGAGADEVVRGVDARVDLLLDDRALDATGISVDVIDGDGVSPIRFDGAGGSDWTFVVDGGAVDASGVSGGLALTGGLMLSSGDVAVALDGLALQRDASGEFVIEAASLGGRAAMALDAARVGFGRATGVFQLHAESVRLGDAVLEGLGLAPGMGGEPIGSLVIEADAAGHGRGSIRPAPHADGGPLGGGEIGPDVTFCELYGLAQFGSTGDIVGLSLATTSWNVGDRDLLWYRSPDPRHPFIVMNLYRLMEGKFEQIGQSWIKHGFFALSNTQCGGSCTHENGHRGGQWLGIGCTDTYGASLNASQSGLGPRYEVNPWTGEWEYEDSVFDLGGPPNNGIRRRLQVYDDDLDPAMNEGATYYGEGYYVCLDDVNVMNSVSWKPVTVSGRRGDWDFGMSNRGTRPTIGFAIDAWATAQQTLLAQEIPVVEFESPDGRCILAAEATDLGGGRWHYEYALLNVDMDRQVGSFSIPVPSDADITNVGFHAVHHHDEPFNLPTWREGEGRVPIDNDPWDAVVSPTAITWSTDGNPLRWGTLYNFRFDADVAPASTTATLGMFRPGTPETVRGVSTGPLVELTHYNPESLEVTRGVHSSGDREDLVDDDEVYVIVTAQRPTKIAAASVEIEVGGTVPATDPFELRFTVDASVTGAPTKQEIQFYNFVDQRWELMDRRDGSGKDQTVNVAVNADPARFIAADGSVLARIGYVDHGVTEVNWVGRFDTAYWSVVE